MAEPLLKLRAWSLVRDGPAGPVTLLRDVDFELRRGEWVALLGANGSGKTSLLRWLASELSPLRERAGLVFQDPDDSLIAATTADELGLGRPGLDPGPALRQYGLEAVGGLDPRLLSAGEKQRLAFAAVEAAEPAVLLCDEPASLQDAATADWLLERVVAWRARTGGAVVFATQSRREAARAERIVVLEGGRIAADGPRDALLDSPAARRLLEPRLEAGAAPIAPAEPAAIGGVAATGATEPIAAWREVACRFAETGRGFGGVDLELRPGDRIGLTGPSGAGKSTLLACAAGVRAPTAGRCWLQGRPLCAARVPDLDHGAALLAPQFPEYLFTRLTVADEVALDPALAGPAVEAVLAAAGLPPECAGRNPHDLSSGERRRLAVVLVALSGRPLLMFDEPAVGLDAEGRARIGALLRGLPAGAAVVIAGHDIEFLRGCGCRILALGPEGLTEPPGHGVPA